MITKNSVKLSKNIVEKILFSRRHHDKKIPGWIRSKVRSKILNFLENYIVRFRCKKTDFAYIFKFCAVCQILQKILRLQYPGRTVKKNQGLLVMLA